MVARLASIAKWYQKVAGSSPAVVTFYFLFSISLLIHVTDASSTLDASTTMAKAFSDHTSNPLQASASDPINNDYLYIYNQAKQLAPSSTALSSEDELAVWSQQETYQEHVKSVTAQDRFNQFSTPKHADEDMSEDELAFPNNHTTIDPRNQFAFRIKANEKAFLAFEDTKLEDLLEDKPADDEDTVEQDEHIIMDDSGEHDDHNDLDDYSVEDDEMSFKNGPFPEPSRFSPLSPFSSPQSSRPSSPDESRTLYSRSTEEQAEIQQEITTLYKAVPQLKGQYQLLDRLGTGTFSSVYKAIDLLYDDWENRPWLGNHPPESTAYYQSSGPTYKGRGGRGPKQSDVDIDMDAVPNTNPSKVGAVYVAIKRIYTTSGPDRIRNELSILEACRGCRHASQIITAFRCSDQVVIVLAYQRNMDFRVREPARNRPSLTICSRISSRFSILKALNATSAAFSAHCATFTRGA